MEHDYEPVRGLPGALPPGERILWQGGPDPWVFARTALKTRWIAAYFVAFAIYGMAQGSLAGAAMTLATGLVCLGMLGLFAWGVARTTVYTLTDRRLVLRIGVALNVCFNLPLKAMTAGEMRPLGNGFGDIALSLEGARIGYALLWPHARPWRLKEPQPMLRAIPEAQAFAALLAGTRTALGPAADVVPERPIRTPDLVLGAAA